MYTQPIFDVGQLYYPETLHCLYIVNAPFIFYSAWKVISAIIQPETREKIQVFVRDFTRFALGCNLLADRGMLLCGWQYRKT